MGLNKLQIQHVAKLASLSLTDDEEKKYAVQLSAVLDYIDQLDQVDTSGVIPTYNVSGNSTVLASDTIESCLTQDDALKNSPKEEKGFFVTKGVFGQD